MTTKFETLIDAYRSAHRWRESVAELRDYHVQRLPILSGLFECDLDAIERDAHGRSDHDRTSVVDLARTCIAASPA
jgi:hypothetical protein